MKNFVVSGSDSESSNSGSVVSLSSGNGKEKVKPGGRLTRARRNGIVAFFLVGIR